MVYSNGMKRNKIHVPNWSEREAESVKEAGRETSEKTHRDTQRN